MTSTTIQFETIEHGTLTRKQVLQFMRLALNEMIKYESEREDGRHYWHSDDLGIELQVKVNV